MSGNDEDQNIINGEVPKLSYYKHKKQGTKYSKRVQKELSNTELKLNLNTLALELGKQKAINKPLLNKISKLVLGRPRKETLQEAYNNLQQIEHNFKNNKTSDKDKSQTGAQEKALEICDDQLKSNVINKEDYVNFTTETHYEFRTLTTFVKGMYNIMNQVKEDLDYFKTYDYVIKADVVKIIVNKIDDLKADDIELDAKTYRWKGVFKDKTLQSIKYDKAWNANKNLFQYKAYNMDPNNETPLECVPNALFKMYGDKSKGI